MLIIIDIFICKIGPSFSTVLGDSGQYQAAGPEAKLKRDSCPDLLVRLEEHFPYLLVILVDQILNYLIGCVIKSDSP